MTSFLNISHKSLGMAITMLLLCMGLVSCGNSHNKDNSGRITDKAGLQNSLSAIIKEQPGKIGIAVIYDNADTLTVNDSADYPMMSMFKLHEAIAVCHALDNRQASLDSAIHISRSTIDMDTWSPMLKDYTGDSISITIGKLIDYLLVHSDNNASNLLFERIVSPVETDRYIRSISPDGEFRISWMEADMKKDIMKSYDNRTSPLSYASLINKVFTDSLVIPGKQEFIKDAMERCQTGMSRIAAGLPDNGKVRFAHRTGSGYTNSRGEVVAVNDGGYVTLPDGNGYSIAVFIKDFGGSQEEAEKIIAMISATIYSHLTNNADN